MANTDRANGLTPIRHLDGRAWNGAANPYFLPADYGTAMFVGDPVVITGTSNTAVVHTQQGTHGGQSFAPGTLPAINRAGTANSSGITGVIVSFDAAPGSGLENVHNPASTARVAYVADDPGLIFEVQEDDGGTALAATSVGLNCNLLAATGSTTTNRSAFELDRSDAASAATRQVRILRLVNRVDNEIGDWARWEVQIITHTSNPRVAGI